MRSNNLVCLDVGEKRIGVALGDESVKIAMPYETIDVDGSEIEAIATILEQENPRVLIIGYPRNQSGESTKQTKYVEDFAKQLEAMDIEIVFQDESLTSVMAEERLKSYGRSYTKADIDAQAAAIILQDYLELKNA